MTYPIGFKEIDTTRQTPSDQVELNDTYAAGLPSKTKNVLLIAPDGKAVPDNASVLTRAIGSVDDAKDLGGVNIARMVDIMIRTHPGIMLDLLTVPPPQGAVAGVGHITFATNSDADGTMHIYIGTYHVQVSLLDDMTPEEAATAAVAAINAGDLCPVTAAVDGQTPAKVNLTYNVKGTLANAVPINVIMPETKMTATITAFSAGTAGSGDPTVDEDDYKDINYHEVVHSHNPGTDGLIALKAGADYMIAAQRGHGALHLVAILSTYSGAITAASSVNRFDFCILQRTPGVHLLPPHEYAAYVAAIIAKESDPAAPFIDEPLPEDIIIEELVASAPLTDTEIEASIRGGVTVNRLNKETMTSEIPMIVSTATKTKAGAATTNLASVSKFFGLRYTRDAILQKFRTLWPSRSSRKMVDGMAGTVKGVVLSVLYELAAPDQLILSKAFLDEHKTEMSAQIDPANVEYVSMSAIAPVLPAIRGTSTVLYLVTPGQE
jgi:phage tail sheath gpL-like